MTERRLPAGFNSASQNDIIQKGAGGLWVTRGPGEIIIPGRLLARTVYTTPVIGATHSLNALCVKYRVYGHGAGGGGGGADGSGGSTAAVGGAGMCGAYFDHIFTVNPSFLNFTFTIGTGGAGGNGTGPTSGGAGTATTVQHSSGTFVGGNGGSGGSGNTALGSSGLTTPASTGGTVLGSPDIGIPGQSGGVGIVVDINNVAPGAGGSMLLARGGRSFVTPSGTPTNGVNGVFGGGASGAAVGNTTAEPDGGVGGDGILIVEEYS